MDQLTRAFSPPGRIDLAREADFRVGGLLIRPSRCVVEADGESRLLQRRVMQVLVALAHPAGAVVSQRELILRCWDGLTVSDDAIGRCIGQLRRLASDWPEPPFEIETIPGVGYRLTVKAADTPQAEQAGTRRRRWPVTGTVTGAAMLVVAGVTIGVGVWFANRGAPAPSISIEPIQVLGGGAEARTLASTIADGISGYLNETGVQSPAPKVAFPFMRPARSDLLFGGTVDQDGGRTRARLYLQDRRTGATLWSEAFEQPTNRAQRLSDQAAAAATDAMFSAIEAGQQPGVRLSPQSLALYIQAIQALANPEPLHAGSPQRDLEQVLQLAPTFVMARGSYALALVQDGSQQSPPENEREFTLAAAEADQAIRQDPTRAGPAYDTLYKLERARHPTSLRAAEAHLLTGLDHDPGFPYLWMRECQFLDNVGRPSEAMPYCQRAIALRPMGAPIGWRYAQTLVEAGMPQWAERQIDQATRLNPTQEATRLQRFEMLTFGPTPQKALDLLEDGDAAPHFIAPNGLAALKLTLLARTRPSPAQTKAAVKAIVDADANGYLQPGEAVLALVQLNARDKALDALEKTPMSPGLLVRGRIEFMVDPAMAVLGSDPRYWAVMRKFGLVRYWTETNTWPDFCARPGLGYHCKAQAAKALRPS
jgi:DNA-binding winged helix-turn-helix (wHTH) protein/tetratricopeptide (TPR) repeat protein